MTSELINILIKLAEEINSRKSINKVLEKISFNNKVSKNLVAALYSWIYDKINRDSGEEQIYSGTGTRILSEDEIEQIGIENYNYILHLLNLGLLDYPDLEKIIEQALVYPEGELDDEQINLLVLSIFLEININLPPGSRFLLYSSDTIN